MIMSGNRFDETKMEIFIYFAKSTKMGIEITRDSNTWKRIRGQWSFELPYLKHFDHRFYGLYRPSCRSCTCTVKRGSNFSLSLTFSV